MGEARDIEEKAADPFSRRQKILRVLMDCAIITAGHIDFNAIPIFLGLILITSIIHHFRLLGRFRYVTNVLYVGLLISAVDASILQFGILAFRIHFLLSLLTMFVVPAGVAWVLRRRLAFLGIARVFLLISIASTAVTANVMIAQHDSDAAVARFSEDPALHAILRIERPKGIVEMPRGIQIDQQRNVLWMNYRFRFSQQGRLPDYQPAALERVDLATGQVRTIHLQGAEVIGMGIDRGNGDVYLSVVRRPRDNPDPSVLPGREAIILDARGEVRVRRKIPGAHDDYFDYVSIFDDTALINTTFDFIRTDKGLANLDIQPAYGTPGSWWLSSAAQSDTRIYRAYGGNILKGGLSGSFGLDAVDVRTMETVKTLRDSLSGHFEVIAEPNGNRVVSINHWVDTPEIQVYDGDLELLRRIPLSMVSRAVGADFQRNVVAAVGYARGRIEIFDLDTGAPLLTHQIPGGSRCVVPGPGGEFYIGTETGLYRLDVPGLLNRKDAAPE
jgi:hypothetical protein